jgi:hypothetical protein
MEGLIPKIYLTASIAVVQEFVNFKYREERKELGVREMGRS